MKTATNRALKGLSLAVCAGFLGTAAHADTAGSNLSVTANVTNNCTVSTGAVAFGPVNVISGANVDGTGSLSVTCTKGAGWTAAAGVGGGTGATLASRKMAAGTDLLNYTLYTDSSRSSVWGNGTGSTAQFSGTGTGAAQSSTIYGRVPSGQTSVPAGNYSDTVSVTVTY